MKKKHQSQKNRETRNESEEFMFSVPHSAFRVPHSTLLITCFTLLLSLLTIGCGSGGDNPSTTSTLSPTTSTNNPTSTTTVSSTTTTIPAGGTISADTTWSGTVLVNSSVTVASGATLTIQPGTTVKFKNYRGYQNLNGKLSLTVRGGIIAEGNAQQPIYFTSDAADPQNGDWSMLRLQSPNRPCRFDFVVFEFAQHGLNVWQANVPISHCVFRFNNWEGVYFESHCTATLEACQIHQNGYNGLAAEQYNNILMISCEVWRNGTNGVHTDATELEIRSSRVHNNNANGLSVDNNGTLRALGVALYNNSAFGINAGEGTNTIQISQVTFSNNSGGEISGAYSEIASPYYAPAQIDIGFTPNQTRVINYIPGDQTEDHYLYVYSDDETRTIVSKIGQGLGLTWSLAWDGQYLWTATVSGIVYKLNPTTGAVLNQFSLNLPQPWGMTYDGEKLWVVDFSEKSLSKVNPTNGSIEATFSTPDTSAGCKGIAWDGTHLYVMGWANSEIYQMDRSGNLISTISLNPNVGAGGGLAWDGSSFWIPVGGSVIVKYSAQGIAQGYIYAASEGTWDLEWDGTYLWACQRTNENWDDAKLFKLEILSLKTQY